MTTKPKPPAHGAHLVLIVSDDDFRRMRILQRATETVRSDGIIELGVGVRVGLFENKHTVAVIEGNPGSAKHGALGAFVAGINAALIHGKRTAVVVVAVPTVEEASFVYAPESLDLSAESCRALVALDDATELMGRRGITRQSAEAAVKRQKRATETLRAAHSVALVREMTVAGTADVNVASTWVETLIRDALADR